MRQSQTFQHMSNGVSKEEGERNRQKKNFKKQQLNTSQNLMKNINLQIQENSTTPSRINTKRTPPRHIIVKLLKAKDQEKNPAKHNSIHNLEYRYMQEMYKDAQVNGKHQIQDSEERENKNQRVIYRKLELYDSFVKLGTEYRVCIIILSTAF